MFVFLLSGDCLIDTSLACIRRHSEAGTRRQEHASNLETKLSRPNQRISVVEVLS